MSFRFACAAVLSLVVIVVIAGCTGQSENELTIPGHENRVYEFSYSIKDTLQIPVNDAFALKQLIDNNNVYIFVFDGSDEIDNGRFRVSMINIVTKLKMYYAAEKNMSLRTENFPVFYFLHNNSIAEWYNSMEERVQAPVFSGPVIWFKGQNTGANMTAVTVNGNIIYVSGASGRDVERAADRFVLAVFGING